MPWIRQECVGFSVYQTSPVKHCSISNIRCPMKTLALLLLLSSPAFATTQVINCANLNNPTHPPQYIPVTPSQDAFAKVSVSVSGTPWICTTLGKYPETNFVQISNDRGVTFSWVTLQSLGLGLAGGGPPAPLPLRVNLSWIPPTTDTLGHPITTQITYKLLKGLSIVALTQFATSPNLSFVDNVPMADTVNVYYSVIATCINCKDSQISTPVLFTFTKGKITPNSPSSVVAK